MSADEMSAATEVSCLLQIFRLSAFAWSTESPRSGSITAPSTSYDDTDTVSLPRQPWISDAMAQQ